MGHRRSYGDVAAWGSASVVAGDYNIHMERPTFHVSCPCLCDSIASGHRTSYGDQRASLVLLQESADTTPAGNKYNKAYANLRNGAHPANRLSKPAEQDCSTGKTHEGTDTAPLQAVPARLVASSAERRTLMGKNNLVAEPDTTSRAMDRASQLFSEHFTTQDETTQSTSRGVRSNTPDSRSIGQEYQRRTCIAPLQTPIDLQSSVTFRDDLTKPCIFARENSLHRLFLLRRERLDWTRSVCTESFMPASQIKERIDYGPNKYRRKKQNIQRVLGKLGLQARHALQCLLEKVNHCDPHDYKWFIVAVDIENFEITKRTGTVDTLSVVLARTLDNFKEA